MDVLGWTVLVGAVALAAALIAVVQLTWENAGSRTIVLATGALLGTSVLFVVQVFFELRGSSSHEYIGVEYTVNHETAAVGQWSYADVVRGRAEINASNWLRDSDKGAFDRESQRVDGDLAMYSLIFFLAWEEQDWQHERTQILGQVTPGVVTLTEPLSTDKDSTTIAKADLMKQLSGVGNIFTDVPLPASGVKMHLPPETTLEISERSLTIKNPVCKVVWELSNPFSVAYIDPRTRTVSPKLPSGQQKYQTFTQRFKVTVTYFRATFSTPRHVEVSRLDDPSAD